MVSSKQNSLDVDDSASPLYSVQPVTVHSPTAELSRPSQNVPMHATSKAFSVSIENDVGKGFQEDVHGKLHPEKYIDGAISSDQTPSSAVPGHVAQSSLSKCSRSISTSIEHSFFWYGKTVATYPVLFILLCFALTAISSIGLINFQTENRPFKLWIPHNSDFIKINNWQQKHFPSMFRFHVAIYEAENVLDKKVLLELLRVHYNVADAIAKVEATITDGSINENRSVTAGENGDVQMSNIQFKDVCAKLPSIVSSPFFGRKKRDAPSSEIIKEAFMNDLKEVLSLNLNRNSESHLDLYDLVIGAQHRLSDESTIGNIDSGLQVNDLALDKQFYGNSLISNSEIKYESLPSINVYYEHKRPNLSIINKLVEADKASKTVVYPINSVPIIQKDFEFGSVNDLDPYTLTSINDRKLNYSQLAVQFLSATKENASEPLNTFKISRVEEMSGGPSDIEVSSASQFQNRRVRRQGGVDWSTLLFLPGSYCTLLEQIDLECFEKSLLELWGYNKDLLESLSQEEILDAVNNKDSSAIFGYPTNFSDYLGGVTRDAEGRIVGAKVMTHSWLTKINASKIVKGKFIDEYGSGVEVDEHSVKWEEKFVDILLDASGRPEGINLYVMSAASFAKISGDTIEGDLGYFVFGYMVVFLYVQVMLGKFNCIECRPLLSFLGIMAVQMAIVISYGLSSGFGLEYGPVNNILPFLLLGLGIDDMFVIMQAWNNLSTEERSHPLPIRMGYAMQHAGASITVTSATDIVAFAIGGITVLPALKSFCVYAAIGIGAVFFLQATYFVAWFTLDQRRAESRRNSLICCWKMSNSYSPNACSQRDLCQTFFADIYSKAILKPAAKAFVMVGTFVLFGVSCWGLSNLRQEFNAIWFLPQDSYLYKFFLKKNEFFPSMGDSGVIFFSNMTLHEELSNIESLIKAMESNEYVGEVESWYSSYKRYYEDQGYIVPDPDITEETFQEELGSFLYSPSGSRYREKNFKFDSSISCSEPAPPVTASSIDFKYKRFFQTRDKIAAMHSVKAIAASSNMSGFVAPYARIHSSWETDEVIEQELYQNMSLAVLVVFLMTFALIASMVQSLFVLSCVIMTLVDVGAMMHWWGLTIDTVSCVDLVLAIGLCVDYAAHIGHMFMTCYGSRDERVRETLARIGPAVLNGGFSTFLAFCFLAGSNSHVFTTFFKVFFGVCLYGLFHGLVYLPVLLSLVGPKPYARPTPMGTDAAAAKYTSRAADANSKASPSIEMERCPSNEDGGDPSVLVTSPSLKKAKLNPRSFDDYRQNGNIILPNTVHECETDVMQVDDLGKRPLSTVNNTGHSDASNNNSDSNYNSCVSDLEADIDYIDADVDTTSKLLEKYVSNDGKNTRSNDGAFTIVGPNVPIADGEDSDGGMGCPRSKVRRITTNDDDGSGTEV